MLHWQRVGLLTETIGARGSETGEWMSSNKFDMECMNMVMCPSCKLIIIQSGFWFKTCNVAWCVCREPWGSGFTRPRSLTLEAVWNHCQDWCDRTILNVNIELGSTDNSHWNRYFDLFPTWRVSSLVGWADLGTVRSSTPFITVFNGVAIKIDKQY